MRKKLILLTGMPGSGKSIVVEIAKELGIEVLSMGDIVREEVAKRGLEPTSANMLRIAKELRITYGPDAIAKLLINRLKKIESRLVLIDGVRNLQEVRVFRDYGDCVILAIHSSPKTRYERLRKRGRPDDPKNWNEFTYRDSVELELGIGNVIALADYVIVNEGSIGDFRQLIVKYLMEVLKKFEDQSRS